MKSVLFVLFLLFCRDALAQSPYVVGDSKNRLRIDPTAGMSEYFHTNCLLWVKPTYNDGTNVYDLSGGNNVGGNESLFPNWVSDAPCYWNFGTTNIISIPSTTALNWTNGITWITAFRITGYSTVVRYVFNKYAAGGNQRFWSIMIHESDATSGHENRLRFGYSRDGTSANFRQAIGAPILPLNTIIVAGVTYSGTGFTMFTNGVKVTVDQSAPYQLMTPPSVPVELGNLAGNSGGVAGRTYLYMMFKTKFSDADMVTISQSVMRELGL